MSSFVPDLRYALRQLRRNPAFALGTVATLALGIGATAAVFSAAQAVLFRPLPFSEPDRVVGRMIEVNETSVRVAVSVLEDGVRDSLLGIVAGSVIALALAPILEGLLFEVPARDPATMAAVAILLTAVAAAASWVPARRAMRVEPMAVLREE